MATKQEKVTQRAVNREHKKGKTREEKHILWFLLAVIAILLWLLLAGRNGWWPYSPPQLGSAFYTNIAAGDANAANKSASSKSGTNGSGGGSGGGSTTPSGSGSIADFAAGVNVGSSKAQIGSRANGLDEDCAILANASGPNAGKQEVCTYSQGDKIVTVTYLNDRVISASKSGF